MESQFRGSLTITEITPDQELRVLEQDNNVVVDGLSLSMASLFTNTGGHKVSDFQIKYFQFGTSSVDHSTDPNFYNLSGALTASQYGDDTNVQVTSLKKLGHTNFESGGVVVQQGTEEDFGVIPDTAMTRKTDESITFQFRLDEHTANGIDLSEVALYIANPNGNSSEDHPIMVAYKTFTTIPKYTGSVILFDWTIEGVDCEECALIPDHQEVFYGLSGEASDGQRIFDVYLPPNPPSATVPAVLHMHGGAFIGGTKSSYNANLARGFLRRNVAFISAQYSLTTDTGKPIGSGGSITSPEDITYPLFTSGIDSNEALIPSSIKPLRLPEGKTNAFTDAVRLLQYLKYHGTSLGVNPDYIIITGISAGATILNWAAYAPDFSYAESDDVVEQQSQKPFACMPGAAITDWISYYPWVLGYFTQFPQIPSRKTLAMSGSHYDSGGTVQPSSSDLYASGEFISAVYDDIPVTLREQIAQYYTLLGGVSANGLQDWQAFPSLRTYYEYREIPLGAKLWWSSYHHASGTSSIDYPTEAPGLPFGHIDNSGIPCLASYQGLSLSGEGLSGVPDWRIRMTSETAALFTLGFGWVEEPGEPATFAVSTLIQNAGGTPSALPEPSISIDISGVQSSSVGMASTGTWDTYPITTGEHDALFGVRMIQLLSGTVGGVHTSASEYNNVTVDKYHNLVDLFDVVDTNFSTQQDARKISWLMERLSEELPFYSQYL